jgi:hypothetical protein
MERLWHGIYARALFCDRVGVRSTWLAQEHQNLDAAVFAAYGWDARMSDEQLLAKLLELNLERSAAGENG